MKTAGIIGGIAPESTIEYYRSIVRRYRERTGDGSYPTLLINSIDLTKMIGFVAANELDTLVGYLLDEIARVVRAGADFAVFASNTPHIVFDRVAAAAPVPLLSIVEATAGAVAASKVRRVGLIGTRFTMQAGFYASELARRDVTVVLPRDDEQAFLHDKYMNELVNAVFRDETRDRFRSIIDAMRDRDAIEAVILGGTELPLLLRDSSYGGMKLFDTTAIHVERIVEEILRD